MEGKEQDSYKDYLILQYNYLAEEIRFSKRQQMMATWYILLLFGAIVKTYKAAWWPESYWTALIATLIILGIGVSFISSCNNSQNNNSERITKVREKFGLNCEMTERTYAKPWYHIKIYRLYYLIHIVSCVVTILIIIN